MKYHKIKGVELSVCTAEQKIAYNIAWKLDLSYGDEFRKEAVNATAANLTEAVLKLRDKGLELWKLSRGFTDRYDIDAIFSALNAGLKDYMLKPFIAWNYQEIGNAFPAYYL